MAQTRDADLEGLDSTAASSMLRKHASPQAKKSIIPVATPPLRSATPEVPQLEGIGGSEGKKKISVCIKSNSSKSSKKSKSCRSSSKSKSSCSKSHSKKKKSCKSSKKSHKKSCKGKHSSSSASSKVSVSIKIESSSSGSKSSCSKSSDSHSSKSCKTSKRSKSNDSFKSIESGCSVKTGKSVSVCHKPSCPPNYWMKTDDKEKNCGCKSKLVCHGTHKQGAYQIDHEQDNAYENEKRHECTTTEGQKIHTFEINGKITVTESESGDASLNKVATNDSTGKSETEFAKEAGVTVCHPISESSDSCSSHSSKSSCSCHSFKSFKCGKSNKSCRDSDH